MTYFDFATLQTNSKILGKYGRGAQCPVKIERFVGDFPGKLVVITIYSVFKSRIYT